MTRVGALDLAAAVRAVALGLDGQHVEVIGLDGRRTYPHESTAASTTVVVHLGGPADVDKVVLFFGLSEGALMCEKKLYGSAGDWQFGVHLSVYSGGKQVTTAAGVGS